MSKDTSIMLKGIGLIMMIMCHINVTDTIQCFQYGDFSLWRLLGNISEPVPIFMFISGYGSRLSFEKRDYNIKTIAKRLKKLYIHYWLITIVFVTIGFYYGISNYPGSLINIICNYTAFYTTYNYECWFIFPYCIISLLSPIVFRCQDKIGSKRILFFTIILYGISGFLISRYSLQYKTANPLVYNFIQVPFLLFSYILGSVSYTSGVFQQIRSCRFRFKKMLALMCIIAISFFNYMLTTTAISPITSFLFILMFFVLIEGRKIQALYYLGKHSMNIWIIHPYIFIYIYHDSIYSLKYVVAIFIVGLMCALIVSWIINVIYTLNKSAMCRS